MKQLLRVNSSARQQVVAAVVFVSRLGILPANISPLGSFGFFGNPWLYASSILVFDLLVKGVYPGVLFTYLGFAAYPILGKVAGQSLRLRLALLPLASFTFFVLSNLGVWWYWYDHTPVDLGRCFALAVPFYGRTLLSDVVFGYSYIALTQRHTLWAKFSQAFRHSTTIAIR